MRMASPCWFIVSFSDGLGDQPLTITQVWQLGTELGSFADPSSGA